MGGCARNEKDGSGEVEGESEGWNVPRADHDVAQEQPDELIAKVSFPILSINV